MLEKMKIKFDTSDFDDMVKELRNIGPNSMKQLYPFYRKETPIRSGNARNKTKLRSSEIRSKYPYAGRLDDGWSDQAPKGFTEPSIEKLDSIIDKTITRANR